MELVVVSGKGGTGKTTIAAALSELASEVVRVDCDVDASNFHMFYRGRDIKKDNFYGGKKAYIDQEKCIECGACERVCRFGAIDHFKIDDFSCEGCGTCLLVCPKDAIELEDDKAAEAFITQLDDSIISRAELEIGSDGSGKLITLLRNNAEKFVKDGQIQIIDGSPGIGCPVISSITGTDGVLIVTEPTRSGLKDLERIIELCDHFGLLSMVCINKYDINEEMGKEIEEFIGQKQIELVGKIPYDDIVMKSINELKPVIYYEGSTAGKAIEDMWQNIKKIMF